MVQIFIFLYLGRGNIMEGLLLFAGAMLFSGIFLLAPLGIAMKGKKMREHGEYTDAVVVSTKSEWNRPSDGSSVDTISYHTVVKYSVNGREYVVRSNIGNSKPKHVGGEVVGIIYDTRNPEKILIDSDMATLKLVSKVFLYVSIGLAGLTIIVFSLLWWFGVFS
jgi:hypothetical protein